MRSGTLYDPQSQTHSWMPECGSRQAFQTCSGYPLLVKVHCLDLNKQKVSSSSLVDIPIFLH